MSFYKRSDIILIGVLLAIGVVTYLIYENVYDHVDAKAEIYYKSELVWTVDLAEGNPREFSIPQEPNVVFQITETGEILFMRSNCPDQVCVNAGRLGRVGAYAACLPNGVVLKIVPVEQRDDGDLDIVVGQ